MYVIVEDIYDLGLTYVLSTFSLSDSFFGLVNSGRLLLQLSLVFNPYHTGKHLPGIDKLLSAILSLQLRICLYQYKKSI